MTQRQKGILITYSFGFTLIELSIVLVIIGLIIGGILVGQDLIKAANLRSLLSETEKIQTAVYTFKQKYACLPGDCDKATMFWGTSAGACDGFGDTNVNGTATCNGNGDGYIGDVSIVCAGSAPSLCLGYEYYRFWQHLSNAELVKGKYTGVSAPGTGTGVPVPDSNVPITKGFTNGCYSLIRFYYDVSQVYPYWYPGSYGLTLQIGALNGWNMCQGPIFTPADAFYLDTKADDGQPGLGKVMTMLPTVAPGLQNCTTSSTPATATYNLTNTNVDCSVMFRNMDP